MLALLDGKPLVSVLDLKRGSGQERPADAIVSRAVGELLAGWWAEGGYIQWRGQDWNGWLYTRRRNGTKIAADLRIMAGKAWHKDGARSILHLLSVEAGDSVVHASVMADATQLGQAFLAWATGPGSGSVSEMVTLPSGQIIRETIAMKAVLRLHLGLYEEYLRDQETRELAAAS